MTERRVTVAVRGEPPATLVLRETQFGPVVSDGMLLHADRPVALQWVGHRASDDISALLGLMRAESFEAARESLAPFAVPGQTMVVVEAGPHGRAGRVIAAHLPRRANAPMPGLVCAPETMWALHDLVAGTQFYEVGDGIVASANDRPAETSVPVGFFFAPPERVHRLRDLLQREGLTLDDVRALPLDVLHPRALALRDALLARAPARQTEAMRVLAAWDGRYEASSRGALVFEVLVASLARRLIDKPTLRVFGTIWTGRLLVADRILDAPDSAVRAALAAAGRALRRYRNWGGVHRMALRHPLAALPVVGGRYASPATRPMAATTR
jgi:penicillin amidase